MINPRDTEALFAMRKAGRLLAELFDILATYTVAGKSTLALEHYIAEYLASHELISQSRGYKGYQHVSCISINDEVVHGIPSAQRVIQPSDLVKIDICAAWHGYCADMARSLMIAPVSEPVQRLVATAQLALDQGIAAAVVGNRVGDISHAVQTEVEQAGYSVVRDFAGHGIGRTMHEEPEILNYGKPGRGMQLCPGMGLAIEPMITQGDYAVYVEQNGWTAKTVDKSLAAHVEDTIMVTEHGPEVITRS